MPNPKPKLAFVYIDTDPATTNYPPKLVTVFTAMFEEFNVIATLDRTEADVIIHCNRVADDYIITFSISKHHLDKL